jgi:hypothetical protein
MLDQTDTFLEYLVVVGVAGTWQFSAIDYARSARR